MHEEYKTFLKILRPVSRYAVDLTLSEINADELRKDFSISREEFLAFLYESRGYENFIHNFLRTSKDLICLVGPKGSGKTSLGIKITNSLSSLAKHKAFIVFIDIRVQSNLHNLESYENKDFREFLLEQIKAKYMFDLFTYDWQENEENPEIKLWEYILHRTDAMPSELFSSFWSLQNKAAQLFSAYRSEDHSRQNDSYYDWLVATHNSDTEVKELTEEVRRTIKLPHLVYAARFIYDYGRQFIWFDNIDALPEGLQSETVSTLKGNHRLVSDYVATVVAVREENVFRIYDMEHGAPPHLTRVNIDIERNESGNAVFSEVNPGHPAIGVPIIKRRLLNKIIQKRLEFARNYQLQKSKELKAEITDSKEKLSGNNDSRIKAVLRQRIESLEEELSDYEPIISPARYEHLNQLSKKMLDALHMEKAIHLSNNSLREFLMIYRDFLGELLKSPNQDKEPPEALNYKRRHILTLFFRWIRNTPRTFRIGIYDIIAETEKWYEEGQKSIGCILPHLIVTTIWNLTLGKVEWIDGKKNYKNPTVKEVIDRLTAIGFEREKIINTIHMLYKYEESHGHVVEFRSKTFINRPDQIREDYLIYITYRGKCFVGLTCNTFGYLYECIKLYESRKNKRLQRYAGRREHPVFLSSTEYANKILPYLCDIAQMHYTTLKLLRDNNKLTGKDWLEKYCIQFGIPRLHPYRRRPNIGLQLKDIRRALQFETLVDGVLSYFRKERTGENIVKLQSLFSQAIIRLSESQDRNDIPVNFRKALNLPPRQ